MPAESVVTYDYGIKTSTSKSPPGTEEGKRPLNKQTNK